MANEDGTSFIPAGVTYWERIKPGEKIDTAT